MAYDYSSYRRPLPRSQRRKRAKIILCIALVIGVGLFAAFTRADKAHQPLFAKPNTAKKRPPAPFKVSPAWPSHVAAAAVGVAGHGVVATSGDDKPRPTASIAKVITALAILEKKPLKLGEQGPAIPITARDEQRYRDYIAQNGSVSYVKDGMTITQYHALEAMLLPSSNNIADTAAVWAFGSLDNYHAYANKMLSRHGLNDTVVGGDASGLSPKTKSTASDLILLGELALQHPVITEIVAKKQTSYIPQNGHLPNYTRLVTDYGYSGIKVGDSNEAGITLLFSTPYVYKGKTMTLIGVVLGANSERTPSANAHKFMESVKASIK